jgi:hypothetical protein
MTQREEHAAWFAPLALAVASMLMAAPLAAQPPSKEGPPLPPVATQPPAEGPIGWPPPAALPELLPPAQQRHGDLRNEDPRLTPQDAPVFSEALYEGSVPSLEPLPWVPPWLAKPWFAYSDPNDPHRHIGLGQPLIGTSWRNRPWFAGAFIGGVMLDDLASNQIYQNDTSFVGLRLGYDFDHFFGIEGRWAFARPDLATGQGEEIRPASRDYFADLSLAYYPFGDARWRPYLAAGLGFQTFRFNTPAGQRISETVLEVPLGVGVKYYYGPWFTLRMDVTDNLSVGNARISGMHNWSLTAGVEMRFGGTRPSYFPWHTNTSYW